MLKVSKRSVAKSTDIDGCHRCGGLMVLEHVHELGSFDWRCISCGERIDPVILAHRQLRLAHPTGEKIGISQRQFSLG